MENIEALWIDERYACTLIELAHFSGLSEIELRELVELGSFVPERSVAGDWRFSARCAMRARKAGRLRQDFGLDPQGLALVVALLERIEALESEVHSLKARLPRFPG